MPRTMLSFAPPCQARLQPSTSCLNHVPAEKDPPSTTTCSTQAPRKKQGPHCTAAVPSAQTIPLACLMQPVLTQGLLRFISSISEVLRLERIKLPQRLSLIQYEHIQDLRRPYFIAVILASKVHRLAGMCAVDSLQTWVAV